jgi:CRP/FNR family transcriptional regulator, cyclic AMP receptor protein
METIEPLLAEHPLFKGLDPKYLQLMVGCASNVRFNPGEFVSRDGEESNEFFLIRHGAVALDVYSPVKGAITFLTLGEGDVLGWSWLVQPFRGHFDSRAVELTRCIRIDAACLRKKMESDHELALQLYSRFVPIIVDRLEAMNMQLLDLYSTRG